MSRILRHATAPGGMFFALAMVCVLCQSSFSPARARSGTPKGKSPIEDRDQPLAREKWFLRGRTVNGRAAAGLRLRAYQQRIAMEQKQARQAARLRNPASDAAAASIRLSAAPNTSATSSPIVFGAGTGPGWQPLGPAPIISQPVANQPQDYGNVSGRVTAIAVDQTDPNGNIIYVGGAYGGVWKSTNAASFDPTQVTWTPLTDNQATLATGAISIDPANHSVILVGTGEPNNAVDSYYGVGILRSIDAGANWMLIQIADAGAHSFMGLGFGKFAWNPNGGMVVAAAGGTIGGGLGAEPNLADHGLYWSNDAGASWHKASITDGTVQNNASATDVVFNPGAGQFFAALRRHGFYHSSDGVNWTRLADPSQPGGGILSTSACPASGSSSCPMFRGALTARPSADEMYAWFINESATSETNEHIWKSVNSGGSWTQVTDTGITSCASGSPADPSSSCGTGGQGFYDLYISAIPHPGGGVDLYAGAVNLFRNTTGGAFANLTHVYGCNPVKFHPDNHAIDYLQSNPNLIYFGNDGGIYRTENATASDTGACTASGAFQNLNASIGSLSQFTSFSHHPTNSQIILGGTQDNGSPATTAAGTGNLTWPNVAGGDGGFNEIDQSNPFNLFTANTDVTISYCQANNSDPTCIFLFYNPLVNVDSQSGAPVNFPDHGDFYTPYVLDPADQSRLIIGSCRVWRGSANNSADWLASSFANSLSNKFTDGGTGACSASELFYVSALAAGGPNLGGGSSVIYAGNSQGLVGNTPVGGNVWVSTNAPGGAGTWTDRTNGINPNHYDISSIAVDATDASGQTAYLTIMGFTGGSFGHVFKTTNAGLSWADITSNLPDAPADSIVVDPNFPNILYVGTDVGIFRSADGGATWAAFGQSFPNVVVNKLRIFNAGTSGLLRASTHGRGVWQAPLPPDYTFSISNPSIAEFPGQTGTFSGTLTSIYGYNNSVTLSCVTTGGPVPGSCPPTSATSPGSFSVNVSNPSAGDFNFAIKGVGTDGTTHQQPVTLRVVDFSVSNPSPSTATVTLGGTTTSFSLQVSSLGSFNFPVSLVCSGLPLGASCNFPSNVTPQPNFPVTVNFTISTLAPFTPAGSYAVTVSASSTVGGFTQTKSLAPITLYVLDYALAIANPTMAVYPSVAATFNGTLTSLPAITGHTYGSDGAGGGSGYAVSLTCTSVVAGPTCTPASASPVIPTISGAGFTVTASAAAVQDYPLTVTGVGNDPVTVTHSQAITLRVVDFMMTAPNGITMADRNISAPVTFQLQPMGSFNFPVTLDCTGLPVGATCNFNNVANSLTVTPSGSPLTISLTITANGTGSVVNQPVTIRAISSPARPGGATTTTFKLTVNTTTATTDMGVSMVLDTPPTPADPVPAAVGAPLQYRLTVTNNGVALTQAAAYVTFSMPVFIESAAPCSSFIPSFGTLLTCNIGLMNPTDTKPITLIIHPGFIRSITATASVTSEASDTNLANNVTTPLLKQVRPRPLAQRNLPANTLQTP